ncbi:MAG TPA: short-chain fatty acid transporter [Bacillota bacterium]
MQRISNVFVVMMQRYLPDAWLFAILLTLVVFIMGLVFTPAGPLDMITYWGDGFFNLLAFSMQMTLVLVTGHVMASTRPVRAVLRSLAQAAGTAGRAVVITTLVAAVASWINWGFGLIVGALLAREMARQVKDVDYRLVVASAYTGFLVWHAGLSGSAPLLVATSGHFLEDAMGVVPVSETIFAPYNLIMVVALVILLPIVNRAMLPRETDRFIIDPALLQESPPAATAEATVRTPAQWFENTWIFSGIIVLFGVIYLIGWFGGGKSLTIDIVNFIFIMVGMLLHGTPRNYLNALVEAVKGAGGIILQFPFYAGIMGMMVTSGLAAVIAGWFVAISTADTLPFWSFISGGIVNIFVPSGGGQWSVQGPIMIEAAQRLGADLGRVVMGVGWGDAWTNMIQPFWLLPALGIAGLSARDVMGYCVMALLVSGVVVSLGFLLL